MTDDVTSIMSRVWAHFNALNALCPFAEGNISQGSAEEYCRVLFALRAAHPCLHNAPRILEIGFNAGHSSALFAEVFPGAEIVSVDLGQHDYVMPAYRYVREHTQNQRAIIIGDSRQTVPQLRGTFDLLFIDGGHDGDIPQRDLDNCARLAHQHTLLLMDDICPLHNYGVEPTRVWDKAVANHAVIEFGRWLKNDGRLGFAWGQYADNTKHGADTEIIFDARCGWEREFILRDVLPPAVCQVLPHFDLATLNVTQSKRVLVFSSNHYSYEHIRAVCAKLQPTVIVHCSDEYGDRPSFDLLAEDCALYLRQYRHAYPQNARVQYLPLGYSSGMFPSSALEYRPRPGHERLLPWAFVGNVKSDREELLTAFKRLANGYAGRADAVTMREIYNHANFVPVGRGNFSLNCFRIYEAAACGAIPVVVGPEEEIFNTFYAEGRMPLVTARNWNDAAARCRDLLTDKPTLRGLQSQVGAWWHHRVTQVRGRVREALAN